ncbi:hypothetical protein J6590_098918 [Homalodisca vitripennis]|nr:hypothetical protein J6590_098918 [Homalodisca vitripennis]
MEVWTSFRSLEENYKKSLVFESAADHGRSRVKRTPLNKVILQRSTMSELWTLCDPDLPDIDGAPRPSYALNGGFRHAKEFCSSLTSQLWSVTLVSFQFFASMLWAYKWYRMVTIDSNFLYNEHKLLIIFVLVRGIAITAMVIVLFFSYNRKQMRFVRIHYVLDIFDRNLKVTTKSANATMKMVATCIVVTALMSNSNLLRIMYSKKVNLSFQEQQFSNILYFCMSSMIWAKGVFYVHYSHITQGKAARFMNVSYKIEQVVVRNNFRSLMPYQIVVSGSSCGEEL